MSIENVQKIGGAIKRGPSTTELTDDGDAVLGSVYHDVRDCLTTLARLTGTAAATVDWEIFDCVDASDPGVSLESGTATLDADGLAYISAPAWSGPYLRFEFTASASTQIKIVSH